MLLLVLVGWPYIQPDGSLFDFSLRLLEGQVAGDGCLDQVDEVLLREAQDNTVGKHLDRGVAGFLG